MPSFDMDACTETFVTRIKFMMLMNGSSVWRRSGVAWDKVSSTMQCLSGTNVSGRVYVKGGHFEHLKHLIWLTSTHLFCCITYIKRIAIVQIFCISQGSVVTHLRCSGKYDASLVANLLPSPTVKEFLKSANVSQSYERILSGTFLWPTV